MRLELQDASRVLVDLRASGILRAAGHDPTLVARPEPFAIDFEPGGSDLAVDVRFRAATIRPPDDIPASDRAKMVDHMRGAEVLEVARFPSIDLHGRYSGTLDGGTLTGDLELRGVARPITMVVHVAHEGERFLATGSWEGKLTSLGVKPFKALFGALRLEDWVRLRLEACFAPPSG